AVAYDASMYRQTPRATERQRDSVWARESHFRRAPRGRKAGACAPGTASGSVVIRAPAFRCGGDGGPTQESQARPTWTSPALGARHIASLESAVSSNSAFQTVACRHPSTGTEVARRRIGETTSEQPTKR